MDTVFVENLTVVGKHGVLGYEWSHEQQFLVDIYATFDTMLSAKSDNLEDSIDYASLCSIAKKIIEGESVYLVEKLAELIASRILEDERISKVKVSIRKPTVLPTGVPGVTIERVQG